MIRAARGAPHPVDLATLCAVCRAVPSSWVIVPSNRACEWLATWHCIAALHYSDPSACLDGYDDTACPHVFQAAR
jgi:hypothetical protein